MTVTEMVDYVRRMHNAESDTHWSDAEIYKLIEAKSNDILSIIGFKQAIDTSITTVSGTSNYSYPSNVIRIRRVLFNGKPTKLISFRQLEARRPTGTATTGNPYEHVLWADTIIFFPTPNSAQTVTLYAEKKQSSITGGSSTLDVVDQFHSAVADIVIAMMFAKDENSGMMRIFMDTYLNFHIPNMRKFAMTRRHTGAPLTVTDSDTSLETDWGVI